jgi:hypothetical protein
LKLIDPDFGEKKEDEMVSIVLKDKIKLEDNSTVENKKKKKKCC